MSPSTQDGPMPLGGSIKLTGGIEIECLLLTYHQGREGETVRYSKRYMQLAQAQIYEELSAPMRVVCIDCRTEFDYLLPLRKPKGPPSLDNDIEIDAIDDYIEEDYNKWAISTDETLDLTPVEYRELKGSFEDFHVAPIEIKSRVMPLTDKFTAMVSTSIPGHTHNITYREEVEAVYARLNRSFNNPRSETAKSSRLVVNGTASTHVHIGSYYRGFPFDTVKNVMSLVVANEMQIDSIHAADRITGTDRLSQDRTWNEMSAISWKSEIKAAYNVPWSEHLIKSAFSHHRGKSPAQRLRWHNKSLLPMSSYPATEFRQKPELKLAAQKCDVASWLILIEGAKSVHDLSRFQYGQAHGSTVNLQNLREQRPHAGACYDRFDGKMTIEFRQQGGTLQSDEILNWIGVLVALFKYANTTQPTDVKAACLKNWNDPAFTLLDLLKLFGFRSQDDIFRHYARVLGSLPNRKPYAEIMEDQEFAAARKFESNDRFVCVMKRLIRSRAKSIHPETVNDSMSHKFILGGYGQFSKSYVGRCVPPDVTLPKYLTVGFCPPWSEYDA